MNLIEHWQKTILAIKQLRWKLAVVVGYLIIVNVVSSFTLASPSAQFGTIAQLVYPYIQNKSGGVNLFISVFTILLTVAILAALATMLITTIPAAVGILLVKNRTKKTTLGTDVTAAAHMLIPLIKTSVLGFGITIVGFLFLIIPGLIVGMLFSFAPYVVIYRRINGIKALKISSRLMWKNLGKIIIHMGSFVIIWLVIFVFLGGLPFDFVQGKKIINILLTIVGLVYTTILYEEITAASPTASSSD